MNPMTPTEFNKALRTLGWTPAYTARVFDYSPNYISRMGTGKARIRRSVQLTLLYAIALPPKDRPNLGIQP